MIDWTLQAIERLRKISPDIVMGKVNLDVCNLRVKSQLKLKIIANNVYWKPQANNRKVKYSVIKYNFINCSIVSVLCKFLKSLNNFYYE